MKNRTIVKVMTFSVLLLTLGCQQSQTNEPQEVAQKQLDENKENKRIVLDFYQQMFGDKDVTAVDRFIGSTYTQHNTMVADGPQAFKDAAKYGLMVSLKPKLMSNTLLLTKIWFLFT